MLDIWHRWNHLRAARACLKDPAIALEIDPYHVMNRQLAKTYNTEACEQAFSWLDQFCPNLLEMGPGLFAAHVTMMMHRRNQRIQKQRSRGESESVSVIEGDVLREASRARFLQLREREVKAERAFLSA